MKQAEVKVSTFIEYDEDNDSYFIFTNLTDHTFSMTLEFADITEQVYELLYINDLYSLFTDKESLLESLEAGFFNRFLGKPRIDKQMEGLMNLRMKMKHRAGTCEDDCILCSPDLGDDPFPDFTFDVRNKESEGEG